MDLKTLTELRAPSGNEQPLRRALLEEIKGMGLEPKLDRLGNVVVVKPGTQGKDAKRVMLSAHMDEVGLIVANVTEEGFLRPLPIGGVDPRVIISKRVLCGDDAVPGVIGAMAIHLQTAEDRKRVLGYDDIYVDIGAKDKAEAQAKCPMGTYITFDTDFVTFGDGFVSAKALDDRVGCYTLLKVLEGTYPCDVVAVFSSQEEVGCRGAKGAAFAQEPDAALVLEGTTCNDLGKVPQPEQVCVAGAGVAVSFMDRSSIGNKQLFAKALELAQANEIPCQVKGSVSGGNDAGAIQLARGGVPTLVLSVPCRSIHSPSSVCKLSDVEAQLALTQALLSAM